MTASSLQIAAKKKRLKIKPPAKAEVFYPSGDGEPVAETFDHLYVLYLTIEVLRQYLSGQQATVLGNQFLYYAENYPRLRVAPDVMVIFGVEPGGRDNFKTWEEGATPAVIFEMTSAGTRKQDEKAKYELYENLGVFEYWQFDPKGEWIEGQLRGYRLAGDSYQLITDSTSHILNLKLAVEDKLISFYELESGEKLLIPDELRARWVESEARAQQAKGEAQQAKGEAQQAKGEAQQARERAAKAEQKLRELGVDPDSL